MERSKKFSSKVDNVSPGVSVIQHLFTLQNEAIGGQCYYIVLLTKHYRHRQEATATLPSFPLHVHATCRDTNKCLLKDSWLVLSLSFTFFCYGGPFKVLNFHLFKMSTTIPQGKHQFSSTYVSSLCNPLYLAFYQAIRGGNPYISVANNSVHLLERLFRALEYQL